MANHWRRACRINPGGLCERAVRCESPARASVDLVATDCDRTGSRRQAIKSSSSRGGGRPWTRVRRARVAGPGRPTVRPDRLPTYRIMAPGWKRTQLWRRTVPLFHYGRRKFDGAVWRMAEREEAAGPVLSITFRGRSPTHFTADVDHKIMNILHTTHVKV